MKLMKYSSLLILTTVLFACSSPKKLQSLTVSKVACDACSAVMQNYKKVDKSEAALKAQQQKILENSKRLRNLYYKPATKAN